jgi:anti-sigma factor RsiW
MNGSLDSTSSDQEQLVAYLDGELAPDEALQVERRLSRDETFRQLLRGLQEAWDLLDELPQPTIDEDFTQTTVEMVAVTMAEEVHRQQDRWRERKTIKRVAQAAVVAASVGLGFWCVRYLQEQSDREILRDLPVIEHVNQYAEVDDLSFLEKMLDEGIFAESVDEDQVSEIP